jgi:Ni/Fe-hydrogenase subunit HybB-like protein
MKTRSPRRPTFWRIVFTVFFLGGIYAIYVRASSGLGGATMLSDQFTWGLVIGLNVLCGLSLAAGGFISAAAVRFLQLPTLQPVYRAAIITSFLGFLLAIPALLFDLGASSRAWNMIIGGWSTRHALSGAAWCLALYAAILAAEFVPEFLPRLKRRISPLWARMVPPPLLLAAVVLSIVHLYSLARVLLSAPGQRSPQWQTDFLPALFFLSGIWAFLALALFVSWHTGHALGRRIPRALQERISEVMAMLLSVYLVVRLVDLGQRGVLPLLLESRLETVLLGVELALIMLPGVLLFRVGVRCDPDAVYACSALAISGFMASLLNVTITSVEAELGMRYVPTAAEVLFSYGLIAVGVALFYIAAKYLPLFDPDPTGG